jgi:hypothetical protein
MLIETNIAVIHSQPMADNSTSFAAVWRWSGDQRQTSNQYAAEEKRQSCAARTNPLR